jgi:hypothetical protein
LERFVKVGAHGYSGILCSAVPSAFNDII